MLVRKVKFLFLAVLSTLVLTYQNCGKNTAADGSAPEGLTSNQLASNEEPINYYLGIEATNKLNPNTVASDTCQQFAIKSFDKTKGNPFIGRVVTNASVEFAISKKTLSDGSSVYDYIPEAVYASEQDCKSGSNGQYHFSYDTNDGFNPLLRWIKAPNLADLPSGSKSFSARVVNLSEKMAADAALHNISMIVVSPTTSVLSLQGPEYVTKGACLAYKVNLKNYLGQSYAIGSKGYSFSNYMNDEMLTYEAFSDSACTKSILSTKGNLLTTIYLKFYADPLTVRANPSLVHVTSTNEVKVGWLLIYTVD